MNKPDLDELLKHAEENARRILVKERQGEMAPVFHLISGDGEHDTVIVTPWRDDFEKKLAVAKVKQIAHEIDALAVCFSSECWMLSVPSSQKYHERPSQSPNRIETVFILAYDGEEVKCSTLQTIRDKPGGKIIALVKDEDLSNLGGDYESWILDGMIPQARLD